MCVLEAVWRRIKKNVAQDPSRIEGAGEVLDSSDFYLSTWICVCVKALDVRTAQNDSFFFSLKKSVGAPQANIGFARGTLQTVLWRYRASFTRTIYQFLVMAES